MLGLPTAGQYTRGKGCDECGGRGYKGRVAIFELLRVTDPMRRAIAHSANEQELRRIAADGGMSTLADSGSRLVKAGVAAAEDVAFVVRDVEWTAVCPRCDRPVEADFEACPHCGVDLRSACPGCGRETQPGWQNCPYCRMSLPQQQQQHLPAAGETGDDGKDTEHQKPAIRALGPAQGT